MAKTVLGLALLGWTCMARAAVDETPLPVEAVDAFPKLKYAGWSATTGDGEVRPVRPILLTHAGDGSNRIFVPTQQGVIHVFPNDPAATKTTVFLDMEKKVVYKDKENEEGFLGMAFHPRYKETGEFFVYYTTTQGPPHTSVISRFRVAKDNPDRADPSFEEEVMRIPQPFWNHNGGTLAFGPDGYLYIGLGDGGAANDPMGHGQNTKTLLGSILRIDIDRKDSGKNYAIPKDNPFVGKPDKGLPEIWAYGVRNIWRLSFDRKTGTLWAGDVGQDLWEEIDIIVKGGNYGWNRREGKHKFGPRGSDPSPQFIEPIWEYHHNVGKSITGGNVYRGAKVRELQGHYLYADYVTGLVWALLYDEGKKEVVANRPIQGKNLQAISFGEDEQGEVYLTTTSVSGQGIYRFQSRK